MSRITLEHTKLNVEYLGLRMLMMSQKRLKIAGYWN
ncbi:hypothetical protein T4B_14294 [Trichinella pseudospiralis]|uniref:Uncharacterized protein n=1 Tax=Trichinella pseudospiralis TaxID=6337 RepID=A0A0V1GLA5_TRIPS|nr:hypothetical protein T4B_14294 [Trichinella pseudospiralis]